MRLANDIKYDLIIKSYNSYKNIKCNAIELLKSNPKLVVYDNKNKLYELDNIQSLYLYPLIEKLIKNNEFVDYKFRTDFYYGISKNKISNNTILVSGDSKKIESMTGYKIIKLYIL